MNIFYIRRGGAWFLLVAAQTWLYRLDMLEGQH